MQYCILSIETRKFCSPSNDNEAQLFKLMIKNFFLMVCAKRGKTLTISIALTIKVPSRGVLSKADVTHSELIFIANLNNIM